MPEGSGEPEVPRKSLSYLLEVSQVSTASPDLRLPVNRFAACLSVAVCLIMIVFLTSSVLAASGSSDVVGISERQDSSIVLGVKDGGLAYTNIDWHLSARDVVDASLWMDGREVWNGSVDGTVVVPTKTDLAGLHSFMIQIGSDSYSYRITLINQTSEAWVHEHFPVGGEPFSSIGNVWSVAAQVVLGVFLIVAIVFWRVSHKNDEEAGILV